MIKKNTSDSAKLALDRMKMEIANELGISDYNAIDRGNLTSRENGYIDGNMTKQLVEMAKNQMSNYK